MKISYNWLQTFFDKPLPEPGAIVHLFEKHLAEVEDVATVGNDVVIDVNILPDRACYALSHEGIAFELSQLGDFGYQSRKMQVIESQGELAVEIEDKAFCNRYIAVRLEGIDNQMETPKEIKEKLEALGQRPINFIVDLANYVMLDIGQPLHAFDADKVHDKISVRRAKDGEKIMTLDGREVALAQSDFVIADLVQVLAIAGIKGGKAAESDPETKNIILESAHFDSVAVRKTDQRVGIKTDASKRFENNLSSVYAGKGALALITLLQKYQPEASVVAFADENHSKIEGKSFEVSSNYISEKIGVEIPSSHISEILERMSVSTIVSGDILTLTIPQYRKDLNTKEDIADEIGRIIGYDNVPAIIPKILSEDKIDLIFTASNKIRNFLTSRGFSEVYTYSLANKGEVEIQNPLASDKSFMRSNLTEGISLALTKNIYYADLLGQNKIQIFEIGKVFKNEREYNALSVGIAYKKASKGENAAEDIKTLRDELLKFLSIETEVDIADGILELDLDLLIEKMPESAFEPLINRTKGVKYQKVSEFPFTSRDVAVFVPGRKGKENDVLGTIQEQAGELLVRTDLFDIFEKKNKETGETLDSKTVGQVEKTSYAFRLVFQSFDKTLTDEEIDPIMEKVYGVFKEKGWEIR